MEQWIEISRMVLGQWWLPQVLLLLLGTVTVSYFLRVLLRFLHKRALHTANILDDTIVQALQRPAQTFVWLTGLALALNLVLEGAGYAAWLLKVQKAGVLLILGWFLFGLIRGYTDQVTQRAEAQDKVHGLDRDLYVAVARVLQAVVVVVLGLSLLQTFGVSIAGILTFGGIGGLVAGFAAKDLLENFFGGLMLHMDRPFRTGDWIRSPDRNFEGTVERIGWRQTLIRTHSKNALYIPNGVFLTIVIENPGQMSHRMIKQMIGLRYDDLGKMREILADVQKLLEGSDQLDQNMPVLARFDAFNESSVDFYIQCYTRTVDRKHYSAVKQEVLLGVAEIVERHGAEMAFPTRTLHMVSPSG